jgi:1-acyl-sn-glycerol-3-phosphate acyltransferase
MVIYPQSTRASVFDEEKFNSLGVKLATKAGVKVIPIALKADFQGIGKKSKDIAPLDRSKTIKLKFGPLLSPTKANAREVHAECVKFISSTLKEWGVEVKEKQSK